MSIVKKMHSAFKVVIKTVTLSVTKVADVENENKIMPYSDYYIKFGQKFHLIF